LRFIGRSRLIGIVMEFTVLLIEYGAGFEKRMVKVATETFEAPNSVDTAYFEPFYLKDSVAGKKKKPAN